MAQRDHSALSTAHGTGRRGDPGSISERTNTRRLRGAPAPLPRGIPLSKDAVSRLVGRLREDFAAWTQRDLGAETFRYLFLDGWYPKVRIGKQRARVPVLVTLG